jgi:hypothetical protein
MTNVNAVAGVSADVASVAANANNVNIVATNIGNVNQVGPNITSVNTAATNIAAIQAAPTQASNAAASALDAAASAAAASAVVLGNEPVRPTIRPTLNLDFANVKALDPRITFTRASSARYYDGKTVAKAEENLFLQSENFTNTVWDVSSQVTRTSNTTVAPDGTTTADTITADAGTGFIPRAVQLYSTSLQITLSVFAKAGTHDYLQLLTNNASSGFVNFDLNAGTLSATTATGTITSFGNDWYRCTATFVAAAITGAQFGLAVSDSATRNQPWNPVGTETIILWGAQLEQRSAVSAYTATTTQPITNYIPALQTAASGVARFDHNPVTGESLGLLIEESRTNLVTYSEAFDDAAWTKLDAAVSSNVVIAPDGTLTGDKLITNSGVSTTGGNSNGGIVQSPAGTTAIPYSYSFYAKAAEGTAVRVRETVTTGARANISLVDGSVVYESGSSSSFTVTTTSIGNGWWRIALNRTPATTLGFVIKPGIDTGDGYSGIYIWGAQLEAGAFPTSYIPTVASQVTRSVDAASMTGTNFSSWYRADEGTIYSEFNPFVITGVGGVMSINDFASSNKIDLRRAGNAIVTVSFTTQAGMTVTGITANSTNKLAVSYAVNDFALVGNGGTPNTDALGTIPIVAQLQIGGLDNASNLNLNGTIRKLAYYPRRLPNAQLQSITTV